MQAQPGVAVGLRAVEEVLDRRARNDPGDMPGHAGPVRKVACAVQDRSGNRSVTRAREQIDRGDLVNGDAGGVSTRDVACASRAWCSHATGANALGTANATRRRCASSSWRPR